METLPEQFTQTMLSFHGAEGADWLRRLPSLIAECERRWSIVAQSPLEHLTYNYIAPARGADGQALILKLGFPHRELLTEIEALTIYDGRGCVRLLEADRERGALLLERLQPGTPLTACADDRQATTIAAELMRQLWRPLPAEHCFPSVVDWAKGFGRLRRRFDGATGPLPQSLVDRAEALYADLLSSMADPVLLHGDLHHTNILAAERQPWLAIDPKGVAGEPAYEVGALLRNPFPDLLSWPRPGVTLARRIDQLAEELNFERRRLLGWGMAQAVLAAWWCLEDNVPCWEGFVACAELLADL